ncbi:MAG: endonuclease domain-containing protein [Cyanobacteria bacterium J06632_22]
MSCQPDHPFYLPYNRELVPRARALRKNMTPAERKLWYGFLKMQPFRVLRQRPIDRFIVDFYCPAVKLVIEVDGRHHGIDTVRAYDEGRTRILETYGLRIVRFSNQQVMEDFETVCQQLQQHLIQSSLVE